MSGDDIRKRIAEVLTAHYPEPDKCRCGEATADANSWADHAAQVLDEDGRRWVATRLG
jgi:hypothetical protein